MPDDGVRGYTDVNMLTEIANGSWHIPWRGRGDANGDRTTPWWDQRCANSHGTIYPIPLWGIQETANGIQPILRLAHSCSNGHGVISLTGYRIKGGFRVSLYISRSLRRECQCYISYIFGGILHRRRPIPDRSKACRNSAKHLFLTLNSM